MGCCATCLPSASRSRMMTAGRLREKIERVLWRYLEEVMRVRCGPTSWDSWLGFDFSASPHLKGVLSDPEQLRNRGRMYLGEYFQELSHQAPVVVFLEDIHWADDSSLDALGWLEERMHRQSLLIVCGAPHALRAPPVLG
jgi:hypothetical protein